MSQAQARAETERIDLAGADDPRDVVHRAVACLAQGGVVALPTGSSYALAASAVHRTAVDRLRDLRGAGDGAPAVVLASAEQAVDWAPAISPLGLRLAARAFPGPVALEFPDAGLGLAARLSGPAREVVAPGGTVTLRSPDHPLVREILRLLPGPLLLVDTHAGSADDLASADGPEMIVDDGPCGPGGAATVVRVDGDRWSIARPGAVDARGVARMAGTLILFVCTGNTCRSPMAEALFKAILSRRLGCPADELDLRGYVVMSAGVAARPGQPAAAHAVEVVRGRGGSLDDHASRPITAVLARRADHIVAMTADHLDALLDHVPEVAERARMLDPAGLDLPDPVGMDRDTYLHTARAIEAHLEALSRDLGIPGT